MIWGNMIELKSVHYVLCYYEEALAYESYSPMSAQKCMRVHVF